MPDSTRFSQHGGMICIPGAVMPTATAGLFQTTFRQDASHYARDIVVECSRISMLVPGGISV